MTKLTHEEIIKEVAAEVWKQSGMTLKNQRIGAVYIGLELSATMTGSMRNYGVFRRSTGKTTVQVGNYGDKVNFREKSDGTHSYDKIAAKMLEKRTYVIAARDRMNEIEKKNNEADAIKERLITKYNISKYESLSTIKVNRSGRITLSLDGMNEEQLELLLGMAIQMKLVKTLKEEA